MISVKDLIYDIKEELKRQDILVCSVPANLSRASDKEVPKVFCCSYTITSSSPAATAVAVADGAAGAGAVDGGVVSLLHKDDGPDAISIRCVL